MGQIEFEVGGITIPRKISAGGRKGIKDKKLTDGIVIKLDDKTKLKKTDIIKPQDLEGLSAKEAAPYMKTKTLQLTIAIEAEEEAIVDTKSAIEKKHLKMLEESEDYRELVAMMAARTQSVANKKRLRELKNEILRDGDKLNIDLSSEAILNDMQNAGRKRLSA